MECGQDKQLEKEKEDRIAPAFPSQFCYEGLSYTLLRDVFQMGSPERGAEFASFLPVWDSTHVLEIGCGSGCVVCAYFLKHPGQIKHVLATDLNPAAIQNTRINLDQHNVPGEARLSNLFDQVEQDELFDLIFWNAPWQADSYSQDKDIMIELAITDPGYGMLSRYITEVGKYLTPRGRAFISMGLELSDIDRLDSLATKGGYQLIMREKGNIHSFGGNFTWVLFEILPLGIPKVFFNEADQST